MKKVSFTLTAICLSVGAFAFADAPSWQKHSASAKTAAHGSYTATAFGVKQDPHGGSHPINVGGSGCTQDAANKNAINNCNTATGGYGCHLN